MSQLSDFELIANASRDQAYPQGIGDQLQHALSIYGRLRAHGEAIVAARDHEVETNRQDGHVRSIGADRSEMPVVLRSLADLEADLRAKDEDPNGVSTPHDYRRRLRNDLFALYREMEAYYESLRRGEVRGMSTFEAARWLGVI